ncbi:helix-turn-helix domain-containing protein [Natroniella acetigena]|uniref:helix-turn-helix domain-containing protein n=1 Tax=Natroniella acetigena TaxID=52004 RepID=UPI00200B4C37|nr:helix-turn-helix domain-containing protein [Natroniella acetigena]MCK8828557.1 helix-turn-helix domain-containing protein [Natroniella acetigena]
MNEIGLVVEEVYSQEIIYQKLKVNTSRGIKYTGTAENPGYIVLFSDLSNWKKTNPYHDRLEEDAFYYTAEGLEGEQKLTGGNLALTNYLIQPCPIYIFIKLDTDEYKYLGEAELISINQELQYDCKKRLREVFVYQLELPEYNLYKKLEDKEIMKKDILGFKEASELLGVSTRTLTEILKKYQVPGRKLGRQWHFSRKHLIDWIGKGISKSEY